MAGHLSSPPFRDRLEANLATVRRTLGEAAGRAGRDPGAITLLAATKTASTGAIETLAALGIRDAGENRVQEARDKVHGLSDLGLRWHMIGRLQTNKVRRAMDLFHRFHCVDRDDVLDALAGEAARRGRTVDCLIQVNVSGETTKGGYEPARVEEALHRARSLPSMRVTGLMGIPAPSGDPEGTRAAFRGLRELRDSLRSSPAELPDLSMGMSDDYAVAVEEGATILRIGSALLDGLPPEHYGRGREGGEPGRRTP